MVKKIKYIFLGNINNKFDLSKSMEGCNFVINTASLAFIDVEKFLNCCERKC